MLRQFVGAFNPSMFFEGRILHHIGFLEPQAGESPFFTQLYVHDSLLQSTLELDNIVLLSSISAPMKVILKGILRKVQTNLQEHNPFVKDFLQI